MRTHYDNLHVSESAGPEVIRAAYKALAQKWHPDKNPQQKEKAARYFKIISDAFQVLSDSETRAEYDAWLKREREHTAKAAPPTSNFDEREQTSSQRVETPNLKEAVYPWRRFFARFVDTLTIPMAAMFAVSFILSFSYGIDAHGYFDMPTTFAWSLVSLIFVEAVSIHVLSTTFGKCLFGIYIRAENGGKLTFPASLRRTLMVSILGQGCFFPGLTLLSYPLSYAKLKAKGVTWWDVSARSEVECRHISVGRVTFAFVSVLMAISFYSQSVAWIEQEKIASERSQDAWIESVRDTQEKISSGAIPVVEGDYIELLPEDSGIWPEESVGQIESSALWWSEGQDIYVRVTNTSLYSMRVLQLSFSDQVCSTATNPKVFRVLLRKNIASGGVTVMRFSSHYSVSRDGGNCLMINQIWD